MGYRIVIKVNDEEHNLILTTEYFTQDGYETGDIIEREVTEAIDRHLQQIWREDERSLWERQQGESDETTQPAY